MESSGAPDRRYVKLLISGQITFNHILSCKCHRYVFFLSVENYYGIGSFL